MSTGLSDKFPFPSRNKPAKVSDCFYFCLQDQVSCLSMEFLCYPTVVCQKIDIILGFKVQLLDRLDGRSEQELLQVNVRYIL